MNNKNILISGAGIAGTTLAFWLKKFGFNPTIVESAPKLREGGYAIDFWGIGFDIAERMEIVPDLNKADLGISEISFVDKNNKRKSALNYEKLKKLMNNRAVTLLRSDLAKIIYNRLDNGIEMIFGDAIVKIEQQETKVIVTFQSGKIRNFDLLVGADGLHSNVRNIVFGNEEQFEKYYGYYTSSFTIKYGTLGSEEFEMYSVPGKQAAIYSNNENKATIFFIFTSSQKLSYAHHDVEAQKQILRNEFSTIGWKCPNLLAKMYTTDDFYFDVVSQIQMDNWSKDRVSLVGDACDCPSLLSGQGSTLAMVGAYILAGELKEASGNHTVAFAQYQNIFKPFIDNKQKIAQNFAKSFVAKSQFGIWMRNIAINLMFLPFLSKMFIKQFMDDKLKLKNY
jgi:2-polyprenyl-6-methoxyphenol hydroxylase-like FAD-dependent oxidoreductase